MKYYLQGLLYNKEVAALQKSLSSCPTSVPWDVEIRPCTSGSSNECQHRDSRSTELQFPPSITSISRSLFTYSRALAKSFSSVVFLVWLSRQFGLTGRKDAWRSEISSRYLSAGVEFCHVNVSRWGNPPTRGRIRDTSNSRKIHFGGGFASLLKETIESHSTEGCSKSSKWM